MLSKIDMRGWLNDDFLSGAIQLMPSDKENLRVEIDLKFSFNSLAATESDFYFPNHLAHILRSLSTVKCRSIVKIEH